MNSRWIRLVLLTSFAFGPVQSYAGWNLGLGVSSLWFVETQTATLRKYKSLSLTGKLAGTYPTKAASTGSPKWEVGLSIYGNLLPITKAYTPNVAEEADSSLEARFVGVNVRLGHSFGRRRSSWVFALHGGFYYTTVIMSSSKAAPPMGFRDLMGPQLYPTLTKYFRGGQSLLLYAKYSPIGQDSWIMSLANREVAAGWVFTFNGKRKHPLSLTLDAANLRFRVPQNADYQCDSSSLSLGMGIGL